MTKLQILKLMAEKVARNLAAIFDPPSNYGDIVSEVERSEFLAHCLTGSQH